MNESTATAEVRRGDFDFYGEAFEVFASSADAPESMRVYPTGGAHDALVLVVSGLNSGDLKASWGKPWSERSEEWRDSFEERAYRAYLRPESNSGTAAPAIGRVRVCNG